MLTRFMYRRYRWMKEYCIKPPRSPRSRVFFRMLAVANVLLSARSPKYQDPAESRIWKAVYFQRWGETSPFELQTDAPVAADTADHKWPRGALYDNSVNRRFNLKLYDHFRHRRDLRVLDLGCSGGGFVKSLIEDGYAAVGVEGSDVSRKLRAAEWDTIPYHLFTGDITRAFQILNGGASPVRFHCITAWEVLEHIPEDRVPDLFENIRRHLEPDGIFVASVALFPDADPLTGAVYHVTLHPKEWWIERFAAAGLCEVERHRFETADYVRGHGMGLRDWNPADGDGFHVVLRLKAPTPV